MDEENGVLSQLPNDKSKNCRSGVKMVQSGYDTRTNLFISYLTTKHLDLGIKTDHTCLKEVVERMPCLPQQT